MSDDLFVVTKTGKTISTKWMHAVDHLLEQERRLGQWDFIEELIKVWAKRNPEMYESYRSQSANAFYRGNMKNEYGAMADPVKSPDHGGSTRKILDIPTNLYDLIAWFYPNEIKDRKFIMKFAKRFPIFKVPERL